MFNNCDPKTNGEEAFFLKIKNNINVIFDVGCRSDSEFVNFTGEVHYFDPVNEFIDNLSKQPNNNKLSHFNNFGLGNEAKELYYYPKYQSFYDRVNSCQISDDANKITLNIKKAKEYIFERNVTEIDFVKIDTEGYELNVLMGFEELLKNVKIVQFEYGGTFLDNNINLRDVIFYLEKHGFYRFCYLTNDRLVPLQNLKDHYQYCNIVCLNRTVDVNSEIFSIFM